MSKISKTEYFIQVAKQNGVVDREIYNSVQESIKKDFQNNTYSDYVYVPPDKKKQFEK